MSIKTCELETCDSLHKVELKSMLYYDGESKKIYQVNGDEVFNVSYSLTDIESKIDELETFIKTKTDEEYFKEVETELNKIRDLINEIQDDINSTTSDNNSINDKLKDLSDKLQKLDEDKFNKSDFKTFKDNYDETIKDLKDEVSSNSDDIKSNKDDIDTIKDDIEPYLDKSKKIETGGLTFKNKDGETILKFDSDTNEGSDYGYLKYVSDDNTYAYWGDGSDENSALILGVENDAQSRDSDVTVLKSKAAVIIDAPELIFHNDGNQKSLKEMAGGIGKPVFDSGWHSIDNNGYSINNPLGRNALFIGYMRWSSGEIMQFGVFSSYSDDDNRDNNSGMFLSFTDDKIYVETYQKNNDKDGYIAGLNDGISRSISQVRSIDIKIVGWKIEGIV